MPTLTHRDRTITYELRRTKRRRSIGLQIERDGAVTVLIPRLAPSVIVHRFVAKKADWILRWLDRYAQAAAANPPKRFVSGELFPLDGQPVPLQVSLALFPRCALDTGTLRVEVPDTEPDVIRRLLVDWYRRETLARLQEALPRYASRIGVTVPQVRLSNARSRWGSCSSRTGLRFHWRLAMMPPSVFDYVVVHELAHLRAFNHSKRFWAVVENVFPHHREARRWLKENGPALVF